MLASGATFELPPLILHPFADRSDSQKALENARAALRANGLLPASITAEEQLAQRLLESRYSELRMLYFLGKDLFRWIGQCLEVVARAPELASAGIREQSFAMLLSHNPPEAVRQKLQLWGVSDAGTLFCRALAVNRVFARPPEFEDLAEDFIRNYHLYADALFACYRNVPFAQIGPEQFQFALYASGEYSRLLEDLWSTEP